MQTGHFLVSRAKFNLLNICIYFTQTAPCTIEQHLAMLVIPRRWRSSFLHGCTTSPLLHFQQNDNYLYLAARLLFIFFLYLVTRPVHVSLVRKGKGAYILRVCGNSAMFFPVEWWYLENTNVVKASIKVMRSMKFDLSFLKSAKWHLLNTYVNLLIAITLHVVLSYQHSSSK